MMIEGTVAMDTHVTGGEIINVVCSQGKIFSGGAPSKICGNDGKFHPDGGRCVPIQGMIKINFVMQ